MTTPSKWGRWDHGDKALGRWHAIVATVTGRTAQGAKVPAARLACGRVRVLPTVTQARPNDTAKCCPTCATLDDLRSKYEPEKADDAEPVAIAPTAPSELTPVGEARPAEPEGYCGCGCQQGDEARAYRAEVAAWEAREQARKQAAFAAYLTTRTEATK